MALVGARSASSYACEVAEQLGEGLARRGVVVVSGMARGVDGAAHRGALAGGGYDHRGFGDRRRRRVSLGAWGARGRDRPERDGQSVSSGGASAAGALSVAQPDYQWPLGRRRSGRSVRESGSLITARIALEQGRDVMAVPGNVLSSRNRGRTPLLGTGQSWWRDGRYSGGTRGVRLVRS